MSELMSGYLMDYTDDVAEILDNVIRKDYTVVEMKCQELLDNALEQKRDYEAYMDEAVSMYDNMKLQRMGLPF